MPVKPWRVRPAARLIVALAAALFITGCAPKVTIERPPAGPRPLEGVWRLSVGEIKGPDGEDFARLLAFQLARRPGLTVVGPDQAQVLLTGKVETGIADEKGDDLVRHEEPTGKRKKTVLRDPFVNQDFTVYKPEVKVTARPTPFIIRRADAGLSYHLLNPDGTPHGRPDVVKVQFSRKYGGINEGKVEGLKLKDLPPRKETLRQLSQNLAEALAVRLAPAAVRLTLYLDEGEEFLGVSPVRKGVDLARKDKWDLAVQSWREVLEEDPDNPSAFYNLGVSYERLGGRGNLDAARGYYAKAAIRGNNELYREALTRVTAALAELDRKKKP